MEQVERVEARQVAKWTRVHSPGIDDRQAVSSVAVSRASSLLIVSDDVMIGAHERPLLRSLLMSHVTVHSICVSK